MAESSSKGSSKTSKGKTFDVTRPGKSSPSATSRPVIIGHGSMIEDPMVQSGRKDIEKPPEVPPKPMRANAEKVVEAPESLKLKQPGEMPAVDDEQATEGQTDEPVVEESQPEMAEETKEPTEEKAEPEKTESSSNDSTDDQEAVVDSVASQAAQKKQQSEQDKKAAEQAAHIAELIEKKTYFVPINVAKRNRNNRTMAVVLFVLFALGMIGGLLYVSGALSNL